MLGLLLGKGIGGEVGGGGADDRGEEGNVVAELGRRRERGEVVRRAAHADDRRVDEREQRRREPNAERGQAKGGKVAERGHLDGRRGRLHGRGHLDDILQQPCARLEGLGHVVLRLKLEGRRLKLNRWQEDLGQVRHGDVGGDAVDGERRRLDRGLHVELVECAARPQVVGHGANL